MSDIIQRNRNRSAEEIADAVIRRAEQRAELQDIPDEWWRSEYGAPSGRFGIEGEPRTCSIWRAIWIWLQVIGVFLGTWLLASKALIWVANR
jgi:hypothetical protein